MDKLQIFKIKFKTHGAQWNLFMSVDKSAGF